MQRRHADAATVLTFWFGEDEPDDAKLARRQRALWWSKNEATDSEIAARFESWVTAVAAGELKTWAATPSGLLALILLTDQFPRNIYRGTPQSFAYDPQALRWSRNGLAKGMDRKLRPVQRVFFYLPFEHAESRADQEQALRLFQQLLDEVPDAQKAVFDGFMKFAVRHHDIIARFGRFPHRNAILGRKSTAEEEAFLRTPGSSF